VIGVLDDIAELAGRIGYPTLHFFRMFRRSFEVAPHAYVMRGRLALARELLTTSDLPLAEIALKTDLPTRATCPGVSASLRA
jgi:transcriptional regulator GlxA family with amidase domain